MKLHSKAFSGALVTALAGCVSVPVAQSPATGGVVVATPGADAGCKRVGGNSNTQNAAAGAGIGAVLGGIVGASTTRSAHVGARNGALLGALAGAVAGSQFNNLVGVTAQDDGSVKMNIPGQVLFRSGSADLTPDFQQVLVKVASTIREYCDVTASVIGHTDSVGSRADNQRLSERRAQAVVTYLMQQSVDPRRLTATGRASDVPIASNADETGRAQNRRVEIFIRPPAS